MWIRQFVHKHPKYNHDSVVGEEVAYDLLKRIDDIARGTVKEPSLLGSADFQPVSAHDAFPASFSAEPIGGGVDGAAYVFCGSTCLSLSTRMPACLLCCVPAPAGVCCSACLSLSVQSAGLSVS